MPMCAWRRNGNRPGIMKVFVLRIEREDPGEVRADRDEAHVAERDDARVADEDVERDDDRRSSRGRS